jgi:outer membrane protein, heavy metal efflux system
MTAPIETTEATEEYQVRFLPISFMLLLAICHSSLTHASGFLTLSEALSKALQENPEISAADAQAHTEFAAVSIQSAPDKPKFGLMREQAMTNFELQSGPMTFWYISQDIKFPPKYFLLGSAQRAKAQSVHHELESKRLEIREKVISAYYQLYSMDRILYLLQAQKQTLSEIARFAETRRATGAVPQQDEMKAHVEQTKIEIEILLAQEERELAATTLNTLLSQNPFAPIPPFSTELEIPRLTVSMNDIPDISHQSSKRIHFGKFQVEEAQLRKSLATFDYFPDFSIIYRKAFINEAPNNYALAIEMTLPFWFFWKQTGQVQEASSKIRQMEKSLDATILSTRSAVRSLTVKIRNHEKLLQIFKTAMIPQTETTLNSSRAAYRAGRANFLELLDSERTLYEIQISYYRTVFEYVESLSKLEEAVGTSVSTLPAIF